MVAIKELNLKENAADAKSIEGKHKTIKFPKSFDNE